MIRVEGHFGEWMQGRLGPDGPIALVSLPCPELAVTAWHAAPGRGLHLHNPGLRLLNPERAAALLRRLGLRLSGKVALRPDMPVGGGAGASTAALVAIARLAGWDGDPMALARACVAVEGASDPLMLPHAERLLWASRQAQMLAVMPALPPFDLLGGFSGPAQRTEAGDTRFADIRDLVQDWETSRNLRQFAALATESARRTLNLRRPQDLAILDLARDMGALGVVIAHTGPARGLIFPPGGMPPDGRARLRQAGFQRVITRQRRAP